MARPRKTDRRVMSTRERLDTYSRRDTSGCLLFTRNGSASKYPMIWVGGKKMTTSRAQWTVLYGEPPAHLVVRHKCDVRNCIEPGHLELGTYKENTRDMYDRRREGCSKISREAAEEIRLLSQIGVRSIELAAMYGLVKQQIFNIITEKSWK